MILEEAQGQAVLYYNVDAVHESHEKRKKRRSATWHHKGVASAADTLQQSSAMHA